MKRIFSLVTIGVLILGVLLVPSVGIAEASENQTIEDEVGLAQKAGQAWLDRTAQLTREPPEWIGAHLTSPQVYYNLNGQPNAYMFTIENNGIVGHIIVGSSAYGYPVFEAGEAAPPSIPSITEVQRIVKRDLASEAKTIGEPICLLHLGFDHLYAIYEVDSQMIGVNLVFKYAKLASKLEAHMPSPEVYIANKKATEESKPELLLGYKSLTMSYYCQTGRCWCGPASGVSIGRYYRDVQGYGNLPWPDWNMYDWLYIYMKTYLYGGATMPQDYGPGFVGMTEDAGGYNNFSHANDWVVTGGDYWNRVSDINNDWPIAILAAQFYDPDGGDFPPTGPHWIAMRGYQYPRGVIDHAIQCTDSYSGQSSLWLDWDHLGIGLFTCTIKD